MSKPGLLIVDDQEEIRSQLRWALDDTYDVHPVGNAREALAYMKRERPPLVTLDLGLPPRPDDAVEGLALLEGLLAIDRLTKVVVLTGNNERSSALRAIQSGAFDYIQKPVHLETLRVTLSRAAYVHQLEQENRRLQQQATQDGFQGIIGTSYCPDCGCSRSGTADYAATPPDEVMECPSTARFTSAQVQPSRWDAAENLKRDLPAFGRNEVSQAECRGPRRSKNGAGYGDRTRLTGLGSQDITTMLSPPRAIDRSRFPDRDASTTYRWPPGAIAVVRRRKSRFAASATVRCSPKLARLSSLCSSCSLGSASRAFSRSSAEMARTGAVRLLLQVL